MNIQTEICRKLAKMIENIKIIAFDADDTLWVNEPYFQEAETQFCELLEDYFPQHTISRELFKTEMKNLNLYGYGIKGFMLCMIETIARVSDEKAPLKLVTNVIELGHELLEKPIELLPGVEDTLWLLLRRVICSTRNASSKNQDCSIIFITSKS